MKKRVVSHERVTSPRGSRFVFRLACGHFESREASKMTEHSRFATCHSCAQGMAPVPLIDPPRREMFYEMVMRLQGRTV